VWKEGYPNPVARRFSAAFLLTTGLLALAGAADADSTDPVADGSADTEQGQASPQADPDDPVHPAPAEEDHWRYSLAFPMLWMPDISGRIRGEERIDFEIPFSDIFDVLSFGLMFELYAHRGPYGVVFRSNYLDTRDEDSRSGILETRVQTDLVMGVHDLLASFRVSDGTYLLAGARYIHARMDLSLFVERDGQEILDERFRVTDDSQLDWLLGVSYTHSFNPRWGIMVNAEFSPVGDNDRDYSADLRALYRVNDGNSLWFGWRHLNIGDDTVVDGKEWKVDMRQSGPTIGWAFNFR
jgi:hypothetical protein